MKVESPYRNFDGACPDIQAVVADLEARARERGADSETLALLRRDLQEDIDFDARFHGDQNCLPNS